MGLLWRARRVATALPSTSPFPSKLTGDLSGKIWLKPYYAGLSAHELTRRRSHARALRLANSNFRQRQQWYSIQLTMERQDNLGCSTKRPRVLGLVELSEICITRVVPVYSYLMVCSYLVVWWFGEAIAPPSYLVEPSDTFLEPALRRPRCPRWFDTWELTIIFRIYVRGCLDYPY